MKRFKLTDLQTVNELFLLSQRAHLQKLNGAPMEPAQRAVFRAELLRKRLGSAN